MQKGGGARREHYGSGSCWGVGALHTFAPCLPGIPGMPILPAGKTKTMKTRPRAQGLGSEAWPEDVSERGCSGLGITVQIMSARDDTPILFGPGLEILQKAQKF